MPNNYQQYEPVIANALNPATKDSRDPKALNAIPTEILKIVL